MAMEKSLCLLMALLPELQRVLSPGKPRRPPVQLVLLTLRLLRRLLDPRRSLHLALLRRSGPPPPRRLRHPSFLLGPLFPLPHQPHLVQLLLGLLPPQAQRLRHLSFLRGLLCPPQQPHLVTFLPVTLPRRPSQPPRMPPLQYRQPHLTLPLPPLLPPRHRTRKLLRRRLHQAPKANVSRP